MRWKIVVIVTVISPLWSRPSQGESWARRDLLIQRQGAQKEVFSPFYPRGHTSSPFPDQDGDGIADRQDFCPESPKGEIVDEEGCALDADRDGVMGGADACPHSPQGVLVDEWGCWEPGALYFDADATHVSERHWPILNELAEVMLVHEDLTLHISGYSDGSGSESSSGWLSIGRANEVQKYLIGKGISAGRLTVIGQGVMATQDALRPASDQPALNRRVELSLRQ
ncbi:MAG: OmpA family protein [Magnetococcales bacterium]|nr:OmpA family protein [Magnetococcales bacterium]